MPIFDCTYTEKVYYLTTEVRAKDIEEAEEKFEKLLENGDVPVTETEMLTYDIKKSNREATVNELFRKRNRNKK